MARITLADVPGIGAASAAALKNAGFHSVQDLVAAAPEALGAVHGFGPSRGETVRQAALALLSPARAPGASSTDPAVSAQETVEPKSKKKKKKKKNGKKKDDRKGKKKGKKGKKKGKKGKKGKKQRKTKSKKK